MNTNTIPTRTFDYLNILKKNFCKNDIFAKCINGEWHKISVDQYIEKSRTIAYGFMAKGYKPEDKIIVITGNRPEWNFLDMGCTLARLIFVPVYPTLSNEEFLYIFNHSDAKAIFVGSDSLYNTICAVAAKMDHKAHIYSIDDLSEKPCLRDIIEAGKNEQEKWSEQVDKNINEVDPDEVASIVYTSGTTGTPKGVMLTHRNLTFNAHSHAIRQTYTEKHKMLSFLPLCHVYERTMNYEYQEKGISTYYAESLKTIVRDMESCKADGFCAVPRVLETMFSNLEKAGQKQKGIAKLIYSWCWNWGINFDNRKHTLSYKLQHKLADKLIYSKWRAVFGGKELLIVSGGSSIRSQIVKLFNAAKMHIFEGYGMTEASPVISVNSPMDGYNIIGTVGKPIEGSELKFAEDGEILTRGPHVMKGYYKDPQATESVIDKDGWLHTGDIGYLFEGKYVKITDRKKEIFKLSNGKFISPQTIEVALNNSPYFDNSFVFGKDKKFASAVIVVNKDSLLNLCHEFNIEYKHDNEVLLNNAIRSKLISFVEQINSNLSTYEAIKRPIFVIDEWTPINGLLSQTLKLKRKTLMSKYSDLIEEKVYKE